MSAEVYSMNIDAYTNEVKYMQDGKEYTIYNTNKFSGVLMTDSLKQRYFFKRIVLSDDGILYLSQVMFKGQKYTLYKHLDKRLHRADLQDRGVVTTGKSVNSFDEYEDYYVQKGKLLEKIKLQRRNFIDLVGKNKATKLEKFCDENKIGKKLSEQEAVKLMSIIEGL